MKQLTDAQRLWVALRDAGSTGLHSHAIRKQGYSGNPSSRMKDIASKGVGVSTVREARNGRPGSRFWLAEHAPDYAHPVRPNGVGSTADSPSRELSGGPGIAWLRDYTDPDGEWFEMPVEELAV